ncbi:General stress protein 14 [termite gut metagenome]|uniref:General stress protein 14 n=1 Tax=termite gut metagenome TaxID=433724 RepID=A0A5J4R2W6_9ZZZZ
MAIIHKVIKKEKLMKLKSICLCFFYVFSCVVAIAQGVSKNSENTNDRKDVLILVAHPDMKASKANAALVDAVKYIPCVKIINIYETSFIPETYKEAFGEARSIVFQFPFYWASAPHLLKKWCDEIFSSLQAEPGVKGKNLMIATTTGSEYEAYRSGGRNMFTIDELLRPYQVLANHSGMVWQTPFALYGMALPDADKRIEAGAIAYRNRINDLANK